MLAGLRYLDCRFVGRLEDEASAASPIELCRLFAIVSIIREELLYPRYVEIDWSRVDDLIAMMDLMRVIANETETASPSQVHETAAWLRQWRRLWSDHARLEQGSTGLLERLTTLPLADRLEMDLKQRWAGLERQAILTVPEPVSLEKFRSLHRPAGLVVDGSEIETFRPRIF